MIGQFIDREAGLTQAAEFEATQRPILVGEHDTWRVADHQQAIAGEQAGCAYSTDGVYDHWIGVRWIHHDYSILFFAPRRQIARHRHLDDARAVEQPGVFEVVADDPADVRTLFDEVGPCCAAR